MSHTTSRASAEKMWDYVPHEIALKLPWVDTSTKLMVYDSSKSRPSKIQKMYGQAALSLLQAEEGNSPVVTAVQSFSRFLKIANRLRYALPITDMPLR